MPPEVFPAEGAREGSAFVLQGFNLNNISALELGFVKDHGTVT
jgi:hypothetical protein